MQRLMLRRPCVSVCRHGIQRGAAVGMVQSPSWALATRAASSPSPSPSPSSSSASPSPSPTPSASSKQKAARPVETTNTTNGEVTVTFGHTDTVDAYNAFAKLVHCCDADGLLKGSEQAYASMSVLVDTLVKPTADLTDQLIDESKEKLRKNIMDPSARMTMSRWALPRTLMQAKANLAEDFSVTVSEDEAAAQMAKEEEKTHGTAKKEEDGEDSAAALSSPFLDVLKATQPGSPFERAVVTAFQRILPMSAAMADKLYDMWGDHRRGTDNVLRLATGTDLVVESQLVAFIRFDDAMLHFNPVLDCVRSMDVTLSDSVLNYWQTHSLTESIPNADTSAAAAAATDAKAPAAAPGMTRLSATPSRPPVDMHPEDGAEFTAKIRVDDIFMNDVPLGAKALVLVSLDVVCPPQRFARYYDYFYSRVIGCENDYQRMAVSRLFAMHTPHFLVRMLEVMVKPFTTRFEIGYTPYVGRKLQLPEDMSQSIPTARKLVCFYMDTANRWVLSDIFNTGAVISKLPPMSES